MRTVRKNFDAGQRAEAEKYAKEGYKHKGTLKKKYKKIMGKDRDLSTPEKALFALQPMDAGYTFTKGLREEGLSPKKIEEDILVEKMKSKEFRIGKDKPGTKSKEYPTEDKYRVYKKGGKVKKRKNTRRENRLEELGRVDAEKAYSRKGKRNLKSEKKRIVRELHAEGGRVGSRGVAIKGFGKEIR